MKLEKYPGVEVGTEYRDRVATDALDYFTRNPDQDCWWCHCGKALIFAKREGENIAIYDTSIERFIRIPIG